MLAYLIRHAQSRANARDDAGLDSDLTDLGRMQVDALVRRLSGCRIDAVYASPFRRALQTALPIARMAGTAVRLRPELCEYHGLKTGQAVDLCLEHVTQRAAEHENVVADTDLAQSCAWPPLDESHHDLIERLRRLACHLKQRWTRPDQTIVVISHGSPIARLIDAWLCDSPGPSFRFLIDNAAISAVRYENGVSSLICLNEISHLRGLPAPPGGNFDEAWHIRPAAPACYW
jgi:broad specificity phosphatase PhoE